MSLADVNTIPSVQVDVTPDGGSTTDRNYVASNVVVQRLWRGEEWTLWDGTRQIYTIYNHLVFTLSGSDIDQVTETGDLRAPHLLQLDLEDPSGFTVELYPDSGQAQKFEVIAFNPGMLTWAEFSNLARSDQDVVRAITKDKVNRSTLEWFKKYG